MVSLFSRLFTSRSTQTPKRRQRQLGIEGLEARWQPADITPLLCKDTVLITIPRDHQEHSIDIQLEGNKVKFYVDDSVFSVKASRVDDVIIDTTRGYADNITSVFQGTDLDMLVVCGIGQNNVIAGGGETVMITSCYGGSNSLIAGEGCNAFFLLGGENYVSGGSGTSVYYALGGTNYISGGSGSETYWVLNGTNYISLGEGFSTVVILGGTNYISSQIGSEGIILNLDPQDTTISVGSDVEVLTFDC